MIIKHHEIPHKLLLSETLKRRTTSTHPAYNKLNEIYLKERAGYFGELKVDYPLSKLNFKYAIAHDLRLPFYQHYFQMDTLLLTPRYLLILEVKNLPGIVSFDLTANKMIRTRDGIANYYDDPVIQVKEQALQMCDWLDSHGYGSFPIEKLVVMANQETILNIDSKCHEHLNIVVPIYGLSQKIRTINSNYSTDIVSYSELLKLGDNMVQNHKPAKIDLIKRLGITMGDLIDGVFCPECQAVPMKWVGRKWECWSCKCRSREAYQFALKDYYLIYGNEISKREFMRFMKINHERTARYLINKEKLVKTGQSRNVLYQLNYDLQEDYKHIIR